MKKASGLKIVSLFRGDNKRRADRLRVIMPAKAFWPGAGAVRDCTIRNISRTGAKVLLGSVDAPREFDLVIAEMRVAVRVEVMWRDGDYVGVAFRGAPHALTATGEIAAGAGP